MRKCEKCGTKIPKDRLKALPDTRTCVKCSDVKAKVAFTVYSHKTAPEIVFVDGNNDEGLRQADRADRRGR
jgi:hypothetical protein